MVEVVVGAVLEDVPLVMAPVKSTDVCFSPVLASLVSSVRERVLSTH
jgi:hypothetical protein